MIQKTEILSLVDIFRWEKVLRREIWRKGLLWPLLTVLTDTQWSSAGSRPVRYYMTEQTHQRPEGQICLPATDEGWGKEGNACCRIQNVNAWGVVTWRDCGITLFIFTVSRASLTAKKKKRKKREDEKRQKKQSISLPRGSNVWFMSLKRSRKVNNKDLSFFHQKEEEEEKEEEKER